MRTSPVPGVVKSFGLNPVFEDAGDLAAMVLLAHPLVGEEGLTSAELGSLLGLDRKTAARRAKVLSCVGYAELHQTPQKTTTRATYEGVRALEKHWYELAPHPHKLELRLRDLKSPTGPCGSDHRDRGEFLGEARPAESESGRE